MLKAAIKQSSADQIRHRIIPAEAIAAMGEKLGELTDDIQDILKEEKEEKLVSHPTVMLDGQWGRELTWLDASSGYGVEEGSEHYRT